MRPLQFSFTMMLVQYNLLIQNIAIDPVNFVFAGTGLFRSLMGYSNERDIHGVQSVIEGK